MEHPSGGLVSESLELPSSPLVLSEWSTIGGGLRCPVPTMDGAVPLHLSPDPTPREDAGQDQGGSGRGGHRHPPTWLRRFWYHLLQMACKIPLLFPGKKDLLSQCLPNKAMLFHADLKTLRLTAWKLSGIPSRVRAFQRQLSKQFLLPLETQLVQCTKAGVRVLLAGVAKGVRIPYARLRSTSLTFCMPSRTLWL